MSLSQEDRDRIESFRVFVEDSVATDDRYGAKSRDDREDGSTLSTRFNAGTACWFEVSIRPLIPQVRVAFLTENRWTNEECEEAVEESGDSMEEFVGMGFSDAGLDWAEPPVEHYREGGKFFTFATPLALDELSDLDRDVTRDKTLRMLEGYLIAFGPAISVDEEEPA